MTTWVIPPQTVASLAVHDSEARFPIHRIFCVGRNYAEHAVEMGHSGREAPFFFTKPAHAAFELTEEQVAAWPYPSATVDVHHEVELVVALGAGGSNLSLEQAEAAILGFAVGIDMTRRDLQADAKKLGRPWDVAKGFDAAAPIGPLYPKAALPSYTQGSVRFYVNDQLRQQGDLSQMIWPVVDTIAYLSTLYQLQAGDLIMTGTPAGVGAVQKGDLLRAEIAGFKPVQCRVSD